MGAAAADTGAVEWNGAERAGKVVSQAVRGAELCRFLAGAVRPGGLKVRWRRFCHWQGAHTLDAFSSEKLANSQSVAGKPVITPV